jgi:hypothetical protein
VAALIDEWSPRFSSPHAIRRVRLVTLRSQSSLRPPPLSVTSLVNRLTILLTLARSTPNISH